MSLFLVCPPTDFQSDLIVTPISIPHYGIKSKLLIWTSTCFFKPHLSDLYSCQSISESKCPLLTSGSMPALGLSTWTYSFFPLLPRLLLWLQTPAECHLFWGGFLNPIPHRATSFSALWLCYTMKTLLFNSAAYLPFHLPSPHTLHLQSQNQSKRWLT